MSGCWTIAIKKVVTGGKTKNPKLQLLKNLTEIKKPPQV